MARTEDVVTRHLNAEEREIRRLYLLEHPEDELRLEPFTSGFGEIQSWWDARHPAGDTPPAGPQPEPQPGQPAAGWVSPGE